MGTERKGDRESDMRERQQEKRRRQRLREMERKGDKKRERETEREERKAARDRGKWERVGSRVGRQVSSGGHPVGSLEWGSLITENTQSPTVSREGSVMADEGQPATLSTTKKKMRATVLTECPGARFVLGQHAVHVGATGTCRSLPQDTAVSEGLSLRVHAWC